MKNLSILFLILINIIFFGNCAERDYVNKTTSSSTQPPSLVPPPVVAPPKSCREILERGQSQGNKVYQVKPRADMPEISVFCDMISDGGGWTLVALNNSIPGNISPDWETAINGVSNVGDITANLDSYKYFVGLSYWQPIGGSLKIQMGASSTSVARKAKMNYSLNAGDKYRITFSSLQIMLGDSAPGLYSMNNQAFSTYDRDNDTYSMNCSFMYGNSPFWYTECWSGSIWGGGYQSNNSYANAPYWDSANGEYFNNGSIWLK